jgi:hypothetical protein
MSTSENLRSTQLQVFKRLICRATLSEVPTPDHEAAKGAVASARVGEY